MKDAPEILLQQLDGAAIDAIGAFTFNGQTFIGRIIDVIDGDTVIVIMNTNGYFNKYHVRLNGIDVCELHGDLHGESKRIRTQVLHFLLDRVCSSGAEILERQDIRDALLLTSSIVDVVCHRFDKYGRILADVKRKPDGSSLNEFLLHQGLAKPYAGGSKPLHSKENL